MGLKELLCILLFPFTFSTTGYILSVYEKRLTISSSYGLMTKNIPNLSIQVLYFISNSDSAALKTYILLLAYFEYFKDKYLTTGCFTKKFLNRVTCTHIIHM